MEVVALAEGVLLLTPMNLLLLVDFSREKVYPLLLLDLSPTVPDIHSVEKVLAASDLELAGNVEEELSWSVGGKVVLCKAILSVAGLSVSEKNNVQMQTHPYDTALLHTISSNVWLFVT